MNHSNISALSTQLISLGFPASVEQQLQCHICLAPVQFDLPFIIESGTDRCLFSVRVERDERGLYHPKYYSACLRKKIEVGAELADLDRRMGMVDWTGLAMGRNVVKQVALPDIQEAAEIVEALHKNGLASDILRFKYWLGTPLEQQIVLISQHRSAWEITERFYFFDEVNVISFHEAFRFLSSRWMERQLQLRKKQAERSSEVERGESGPGLIMKRKPRAGIKKNLLKK